LASRKVTSLNQRLFAMNAFMLRHRCLLVLPILLVVSLLFFYSSDQPVQLISGSLNEINHQQLRTIKSSKPDEQVEGNPLDGCYHVYLDVGSNVGVQVRKLYEPHHYPEAPFVPLFEKTFGTKDERAVLQPDIQNTVCAVGFEPNPHHTKTLKGIEEAYRKCGWNVKFMTETGVSNKNGHSNFYSDGAMAYKEWGGGILPPEVNNIALADQKSSVPITLLRLSEYLTNVVAKRKIPSLGQDVKLMTPKVLMKMDIEGSEIDVLPDILFNGGLGAVNGLMIEFHERLEKLEARKAAHRKLEKILQDMSEFSKSMSNVNDGAYSFEIVNIDDETYGTSSVDLPSCL